VVLKAFPRYWLGSWVSIFLLFALAYRVYEDQGVYELDVYE
jgi:hypothetical protein